MFESGLFAKVKNDFKITGYNLSFGFGEVTATATNPYIIMYSNDADGSPRMLCNDTEYNEGEAFVQFNVFASTSAQAFAIKTELDKFLAALKTVTYNKTSSYNILLNEHNASPSGGNPIEGLFVQTLSRTFTYYL